jgi:predicted phage-related endonuclease
VTAATELELVTPRAFEIAPAGLQEQDEAAWRAVRREGLGGSDAAAAMGLAGTGRYAHTPWSLFLEKTGALDRAPEDRDERDEELAWFGHAMEQVAEARFRMTHPGAVTRRVGTLARADAPWMRVNLDRRVTGCPDDTDGTGCLWECKNRTAYASRQWAAPGDSDGEGLPDGPVIQVHWGLIVTGYRHGHLSAVIGGNELRSWRIDADPDLHADMTATASWFWNDCVLAGHAPPVDAAERTGKILARLYGVEPGKVITATPAMTARHRELHAARDAAKDAKAAADLLEHQLQEATGDAEMVLDAAGRKLWTWKHNGTFAPKAFREQVTPEQWEQYSRQVREPDLDKIKTDEALYTRFRARQFRLSAVPE